MESTGVYWIPVWNVLEQSTWTFDVVVVNPQHVKALPGQKTDEKDCERLAELGQYDMLRGSFIPPPEVRGWRDLTRRRTHLQEDRNRLINRIGRLLETANIKLSSVVSDIAGKTGWAILTALAAGETEPERLARLACGSLKAKRAELVSALRGFVTPHFRWLLGELLDDLQRLDRKLTELGDRIREQMRGRQEEIRRLCTIPGVKETTAWTLLAELGTDMSQFPDAAQAASWAGLCPGNCESAGKRQSGRTRKGDRYLRRALVQNAWAVSHKSDCFLTALFYRVASRRGLKRACMAVAHKILIIAYHILRDGTVYQELGGDHYDRRSPERTAKRLTRRLENIGYTVVLTRATENVPADKALRTPKAVGTMRWKPPHKAIRSPVADDRPPATPEECRKCANWRIPCLHKSRQLLQHKNAPPPAESSS
jgi:transposase